MTRTAREVIYEWRKSAVNNDDGELASQIDYWFVSRQAPPAPASERDKIWTEGYNCGRDAAHVLAGERELRELFDMITVYLKGQISQLKAHGFTGSYVHQDLEKRLHNMECILNRTEQGQPK